MVIKFAQYTRLTFLIPDHVTLNNWKRIELGILQLKTLIFLFSFMGILEKGHKYALGYFEETDTFQTIQFIQKEENPDGSLSTVNNGTTNEEVLMVLIDRLQFLGSKLPSRENSLAITKLEEALMWLNKRTENRKERGVEGTNKA